MHQNRQELISYQAEGLTKQYSTKMHFQSMVEKDETVTGVVALVRMVKMWLPVTTH